MCTAEVCTAGTLNKPFLSTLHIHLLYQAEINKDITKGGWERGKEKSHKQAAFSKYDGHIISYYPLGLGLHEYSLDGFG